MDRSFSQSTWLLKSKVTPPRQLHSTIRRGDLISRLSSTEQGLLTLLQAPAGYGKTTLLSEWSNDDSSRHDLFCWLTVDEDDDAETFLTYLAFSAYVAGVKIEEQGLLNFDYGSKRHVSQAILSFLAQIEGDGRHIKIVIDDGERLSAELCDTVLPLILRRLPKNATLVVASREAIDLDLSDFEHRGLVRRFTANELRFQEHEVKALWKDNLSSTQLKRLTNYTQGWPVLNRLLQSAYRLETFDVGVIDQNNYGNEHITSYFQKKILDRLDADLLKFFLDSSILEEITEEIFQHLFGYSFLEALRLSGELKEFVTHYSGGDSHYRLHPILREYLVSKQKTDDIKRFVLIQKKVAEWYCDRKNFIYSVRHAKLAEDENFLVSILEQTNGVFLWLREGLIQFRLIDRMLPERTIEKSVTASFMRCIILIKDGKLALARKMYQATLHKHKISLISKSRISITKQIVSLMLDVYEGSILDESILRELKNSLSTTDIASEPLEGFTSTLQCVAAHQVANFELAEEYGNHAIAAFKSMGSEYGELYIHLHLAMIKSLKYSGEGSGESIKKVSTIIRANRSLDEGIKYLKDVVSMEARHEHSPLDLYGADKLMYIAPKLLRAEGWLDIFSGAFRTIAEQCMIHRKFDEARHMLRLALDFAQQNAMPHFQTICTAQQEIIDIFESFDSSSSPLQCKFQNGVVEAWKTTPWRVLEIQFELLLLRSVFRKQSIDLVSAKSFRDHMHSMGNYRTATRLSALILLVDTEYSASNLVTLNKHIASNAFNRSTLFVSKLLLDRIDSLDGNVGNSLQDILSSQADLVDRIRCDTTSSLLFTNKERRILEKLRYQVSDKEIAISLEISHHTVHYHLKKIFAKLNVKARNEAIEKAIQLGIISP